MVTSGYSPSLLSTCLCEKHPARHAAQCWHMIRPQTTVLAKRDRLAKDSSSQFFESVSISSSKFIVRRSLLLFEKRQKQKSLKPVEDLYMRFSLKTLN